MLVAAVVAHLSIERPVTPRVVARLRSNLPQRAGEYAHQWKVGNGECRRVITNCLDAVVLGMELSVLVDARR